MDGHTQPSQRVDDEKRADGADAIAASNGERDGPSKAVPTAMERGSQGGDLSSDIDDGFDDTDLAGFVPV